MGCLLGAVLAHGQARPTNQATQKPLLSQQAFKNVQVLRGIPVKQFMDTMGFFAASLGLNCSDCHGEESGSNWSGYAVDTPLKQMARRMVIIMRSINQSDFGGERAVTCYTCHRGTQLPKVIPSLAQQYAVPPDQDPDEVEPIPGVRSTVTPEQILDKYIQAVGGEAALAKLTSFTGQGTYEGYDSDFEKVPVDVYAKGPDQFATIAHMKEGDRTTTYDGRRGWSAGPISLVPVPVMELVEGELSAARLNAELAFPGQIQHVLTDWRAGFPPLSIKGRPVVIIDGKMPEGIRVKLFFDKQTGLLVREAHFTNTAVGTIATHVTYSDYRPVNGVKIPFQWQITWVDGQDTIQLTSVQPNVAIDASRFAKPSPPSAPAAAQR